MTDQKMMTTGHGESLAHLNFSGTNDEIKAIARRLIDYPRLESALKRLNDHRICSADCPDPDAHEIARRLLAGQP